MVWRTLLPRPPPPGGAPPPRGPPVGPVTAAVVVALFEGVTEGLGTYCNANKICYKPLFVLKEILQRQNTVLPKAFALIKIAQHFAHCF